jgi:nicotinamide-nucleotide adenylyltransferase/phosphinothricin biosynthesis protein PhpF
MKASVGVIHGRFQPLHLGHMEYLMAGKALCDVLVVGITNPDPWHVTAESTDPARGAPEANPFTYYERYLMLEGALGDAGIAPRELRIVPFPHGFPERLSHYAPADALYFLSIYGAWGETKLDRFSALGLRTHVLWRRESTVTSGTEVRARMLEGRDWTQLVPPAVQLVIREAGLEARVRRLGADTRAAPLTPGS